MLVGLPLQTDAGDGVAVATGKAFTVITTVETAAAHGPAPSGSLVVKVNVTFPLVIVGLNVDVSEAAFENVPLGAVQVELAALPPMLPDKVTVPPAHIVCPEPAFAVAARFTVTVMVEVVAEQGPAPSGSLVVKVNVTEPLVMLGV